MFISCHKQEIRKPESDLSVEENVKCDISVDFEITEIHSSPQLPYLHALDDDSPYSDSSEIFPTVKVMLKNETLDTLFYLFTKVRGVRHGILFDTSRVRFTFDMTSNMTVFYIGEIYPNDKIEFFENLALDKRMDSLKLGYYYCRLEMPTFIKYPVEFKYLPEEVVKGCAEVWSESKPIKVTPLKTDVNYPDSFFLDSDAIN